GGRRAARREAARRGGRAAAAAAAARIPLACGALRARRFLLRRRRLGVARRGAGRAARGARRRCGRRELAALLLDRQNAGAGGGRPAESRLRARAQPRPGLRRRLLVRRRKLAGGAEGMAGCGSAPRGRARARRAGSERELRDRSARLDSPAGRKPGDARRAGDPIAGAAGGVRGGPRGRRLAVPAAPPGAGRAGRAAARLAPLQQRLRRRGRRGERLHSRGFGPSPVSAASAGGVRRLAGALKTGLVWLIGHASRFLPLLVIGGVVGLTWQ